MSSLTIINKAEQALQAALTQQIGQIAPTMPVYYSDEQTIKAALPYVVIHVENATETIGPGTGIYEIPVIVTFRDHVKADSQSFRDSIIAQIHNFVYSAPTSTLNAYSSSLGGFTVYGFKTIEVEIEANPDLKAYELRYKFVLVCMPR